MCRYTEIFFAPIDIFHFIQNRIELIIHIILIQIKNRAIV